jgi:hypothetical protein
MLWIIGIIGRSERGIKILMKFNKSLFMNIFKILSSSQNLSIRGVVFYVLNLLSNTNTGIKEIEKQGWTCYFFKTYGNHYYIHIYFIYL